MNKHCLEFWGTRPCRTGLFPDSAPLCISVVDSVVNKSSSVKRHHLKFSFTKSVAPPTYLVLSRDSRLHAVWRLFCNTDYFYKLVSRSENAPVIQADELYFQDRAHTGIRGLELSACMDS